MNIPIRKPRTGPRVVTSIRGANVRIITERNRA